jgi:hypothetical protein
MRPLLILTALSWLCACSSGNDAPAPGGPPEVPPGSSVEAPPTGQLDAELKPSAFQSGAGLPPSLKPPRP